MYAIEDDGLSPALARMSAETAAAELECRAALVAAIRAHLSPPLTVGAALARPEVQDGSHDVLVWDGTTPTRLGKSGLFEWRRGRWRRGDGEVWLYVYALPCRLVPADEADLDPTTRSER